MLESIQSNQGSYRGEEMKIEEIECSGCGQIRRWRGSVCLETCPCLEEEETQGEQHMSLKRPEKMTTLERIEGYGIKKIHHEIQLLLNKKQDECFAWFRQEIEKKRPMGWEEGEYMPLEYVLDILDKLKKQLD